MEESKFDGCLPHGEIEEVFPGVFCVKGQMKAKDGNLFSRNMTILRNNDDVSSLTLINAIRLDDDGLKKIDKMGKVVAVVKIASFHGRDDAFYLDRYKDSKYYAMKGLEDPIKGAPDPDCQLIGGQDCKFPFKNSSVFSFDTTMPEGIIFLQDQGVLISGDSLQNWAVADEFFDEKSKMFLEKMGFIKPCAIGPAWLTIVAPKKEVWSQLMELDFSHVIPCHGTVIKDTAKSSYQASIDSLK